MTALQRAVPLKEVHGFFAIAKHLNFDVAWLGHKLLNKDIFVAKGCLGLALRALQRIHKGTRRLNKAHPLAATASNRLDQHRISDLIRLLGQKCSVLIGPVIARHNRYACLMHQRLGRVLQAHGPDRAGRWPNKDKPRRLNSFYKIGVLTQKTISRMDCLGTRLFGHTNQHIAAQIALGRS